MTGRRPAGLVAWALFQGLARVWEPVPGVRRRWRGWVVSCADCGSGYADVAGPWRWPSARVAVEAATCPDPEFGPGLDPWGRRADGGLVCEGCVARRECRRVGHDPFRGWCGRCWHRLDEDHPAAAA